jgi:hypothetical protein
MKRMAAFSYHFTTTYFIAGCFSIGPGTAPVRMLDVGHNWREEKYHLLKPVAHEICMLS